MLTLPVAVQVQTLNEKRKIGEYYSTLERINAEKGACSPPATCRFYESAAESACSCPALWRLFAAWMCT